jgi:hypothetical protein
MLSPRSDEERLEKYFAQLEKNFPYVTQRDVDDALERPCKYRKILEERQNNPDVAGGQEIHET